MYYPHTVSTIRNDVMKKHPGSKPLSIHDGGSLVSHVLWMLDAIEQMDTSSIEDAVKAGRWIGWLLRREENDLDSWDNLASRGLIRIDKENGHDVPHGDES